jgi:AcrR family transcriptional regulator
MRADAQRNYARLVEAAREAFTQSGADASLEDIARRAGVGIGTLYRHFPTRQQLIEATYLEEVEALCASADELSELPAWDALSAWLRRFVRYVTAKRALAAELLASVGAESELLRSCGTAIYDTGRPLMQRAQLDGTVRPDASFEDVMRLVSGITMMRTASEDDVERVLSLALDGLRYRAG